MKRTLRTIIALSAGAGVLLFGQLAIENWAWWLSGDAAAIEDPLLNAIRFGVSGAAGVGVAAIIAISPRKRRRRAL